MESQVLISMVHRNSSAGQEALCRSRACSLFRGDICSLQVCWAQQRLLGLFLGEFMVYIFKQIFFLYFFNIYLFCVGGDGGVWRGRWMSEDILCELVLSFNLRGPENQTRGSRLANSTSTC